MSESTYRHYRWAVWLSSITEPEKVGIKLEWHSVVIELINNIILFTDQTGSVTTACNCYCTNCNITNGACAAPTEFSLFNGIQSHHLTHISEWCHGARQKPGALSCSPWLLVAPILCRRKATKVIMMIFLVRRGTTTFFFWLSRSVVVATTANCQFST